jgi:hypothetical protein
VHAALGAFSQMKVLMMKLCSVVLSFAMLAALVACASKRMDCTYWHSRIYVRPYDEVKNEFVVRVEKDLVFQDLHATTDITLEAGKAHVVISRSNQVIASCYLENAISVQEIGTTLMITCQLSPAGQAGEWSIWLSLTDNNGKTHACVY